MLIDEDMPQDQIELNRFIYLVYGSSVVQLEI